jgi:hypothetical protein
MWLAKYVGFVSGFNFKMTTNWQKPRLWVDLLQEITSKQ